MNIVIFRFKAVIVLQPCFSAKEHDCVQMYAFDTFETVFLLCPKTSFPMTTVLLLLLLSVRSVFGTSAALIAAEIAPLDQLCTK